MKHDIKNTKLYERLVDNSKDCIACAFDGCHKNYIIKDNKTAEEMEGYGYQVWYSSSPEELAEIVAKNYKKSCPLRYVDKIGDNDYYEIIISQK